MPDDFNILAAHILALRTDEARVVLDCGHLATPSFVLVPNWPDYAGTPGEGVTGTPGYATLPDGTRVCYDDATALDIETMQSADRFTAYVSADGRTLTNWPGHALGRITRHYVSKAARKTYVQVTDNHGRRWYGTGPAESGTYVTLRPYKGQPIHMVPRDYPVRVLGPGEKATNRATCGECGRAWDDAIVTSMTPVPSARCPFEYWH